MSDVGRASHSAQERFQLTIPYAPQDGVDAPTALPLLPGGALIKGRDGRGYTHANPLATLQAIERSFADYPMTLDENHAQEVAAPNGEPSPALARMRGFALRADGSIWATQVEWTPYGLQRIAQRAYVGVSPTVLFDRRTATEQDGVSIEGEILTIENAGLVNQPNFVMPALHAKENPVNEEQIKKLVADAIAACLAPISALGEKLTAGLADLETRVTASLEAGQAEARASHAKRVAKILDRAQAAKKISPASREYHAKRLLTATDVDEFETAFLGGSAPDLVSNERQNTGRAQNSRIARASHDKTVARLVKDMGVKPEDLAGDEDDQDEDADE